MKVTLLAAVAVTAPVTIAFPGAAHADPALPCSTGQVVVTAGTSDSGSTHRAMTLIFSLAPGAEPCTLTGYPGVDTGAGGPLLHADRTLYGYLGGVRTDNPPTVTVTPSQPAHAVVEGVGFDPKDIYRECPTYTDLKVTPPDATDTFTVPTNMNTCELVVHPVDSDM